MDEKELLNEESAKKFKSGLGICLYLARDRIDIQYAVKTLSSYMSKPKKKCLQWTTKVGMLPQVHGGFRD